MALPVTSILIGSDSSQEFGPRLKYQPTQGHIYVQGAQEGMEYLLTLAEVFLIHRQCLTGVLKSESGALPVTSILIGLNITHDFGSKLKSQPLKVTFMSQGDQKGMELPADCSISVL